MDYNCIAWAAGVTDCVWWPDARRLHYWPVRGVREDSFESFIRAFGGLGYEPCEGFELADGFQKVAIYVDRQGYTTHMARQLPTGEWTSKLGQEIDITHALLSTLEGPGYGSVAQILRRPLPQT